MRHVNCCFKSLEKISLPGIGPSTSEPQTGLHKSLQYQRAQWDLAFARRVCTLWNKIRVYSAEFECVWELPADNTWEFKEDWKPALDPDPVHVWDVSRLLHLEQHFIWMRGSNQGKKLWRVLPDWQRTVPCDQQWTGRTFWLIWSLPCWCLGRRRCMQTLRGIW